MQPASLPSTHAQHQWQFWSKVGRCGSQNAPTVENNAHFSKQYREYIIYGVCITVLYYYCTVYSIR